MKLNDVIYVTTNDVVLDIYSNDGKTFIRHVQDEPHYKLSLIYGEYTVVDIRSQYPYKYAKFEPDTLFITLIEKGNEHE